MRLDPELVASTWLVPYDIITVVTRSQILPSYTQALYSKVLWDVGQHAMCLV